MVAASYNELMGIGSHSGNHVAQGRRIWLPMQDDAASTVVLDYSGNGLHGVLQGGDNTSAKTITGPNTWATKAFDLNGSDDVISVASPPDISGSALTVLARIRLDNVTGNAQIFRSHGSGDATAASHSFFLSSSVTGRLQLSKFPVTGTTKVLRTETDFVVASTWTSVAVTDDDSMTAANADIYANGVEEDGYSLTTNGTGTPRASDGSWGIGGALNVTGQYLDARMCEFALFTGEKTTGELDEYEDGPEPIVVSGSDTISGIKRKGQTLSASGATWGLGGPWAGGTNGTITYSYQWTRSNDGTGSGEADISGATSATYELAEADIGKYVRRRVRGTNAGGFDAGADHNSNFVGPVATDVPFSASATLTTAAATISSTAEFSDTYTATSALTVDAATLAAAAATPFYADAALTVAEATMEAAAEYTSMSDGSAALVVDAATIEAVAATPFYADAALATAESAMEAAAEYTPVSEGEAALATDAATILAVAETPFYAEAALTTDAAQMAAEASTPFYATSTLTVDAATLAATATRGAFEATAVLTTAVEINSAEVWTIAASSSNDGVWVTTDYDDPQPGTFRTNSPNGVQSGSSSEQLDSWFGHFSTEIPAGATILSANLALTGYTSENTPFDFLIDADDSDTAVLPTDAADAMSKIRTTVNVAWTNPGTFWFSGIKYTSPDIAAVIQEVVNRPGFSGILQLFMRYDPPLVSASTFGRRFTSTDLNIAWTAPMFSADATFSPGEREATATLTTDAATIAADASTPFYATAALTTAKATTAIAASAPFYADSALTTDASQFAASATFVGLNTATSALTTDAVTMDSAATTPFHASAELNSPAAEISAAAQTPFYVTLALVTDSATMDADASVPIHADAELITDSATFTATADTPFYSTMSLTTDAATFDAEATFAADSITATAALATDSATITAEASTPFYASIDVDVAAAELDATGTAPFYARMTLTTDAASLSGQAEFSSTFTATIAVETDAATLTASADAAEQFTATLTLTTAAATFAGTSAFLIDWHGIVSLPAILPLSVSLPSILQTIVSQSGVLVTAASGNAVLPMETTGGAILPTEISRNAELHLEY